MSSETETDSLGIESTMQNNDLVEIDNVNEQSKNDTILCNEENNFVLDNDNFYKVKRKTCKIIDGSDSEHELNSTTENGKNNQENLENRHRTLAAIVDSDSEEEMGPVIAHNKSFSDDALDTIEQPVFITNAEGKLIPEKVDINKNMSQEFHNALQYSTVLNLIQLTSANSYILGNNGKLENFLCTMLEPFMLSYYIAVVVLEESPVIIDEETVLVNSQKILEDKINNGNEFVHPYSLNLDSLTNCLNVLVTLGALSKTRSRNKITYEIRRQEIVPIKEKLRNYMSYCCSEDSCIKMKYLKNKL